MDRLIRFC